MNKTKAMAKLASTTLMLAALSACSLIDAPGSTRQIAEAQAVHTFDESRLPFGQRIALAQASYSPRLIGLNPYFGR